MNDQGDEQRGEKKEKKKKTHNLITKTVLKFKLNFLFLKSRRRVMDKWVFFISEARGWIPVQFDTPGNGPNQTEAKQRCGKCLQDSDDDGFSLAVSGQKGGDDGTEAWGEDVDDENDQGGILFDVVEPSRISLNVDIYIVKQKLVFDWNMCWTDDAVKGKTSMMIWYDMVFCVVDGKAWCFMLL